MAIDPKQEKNNQKMKKLI